jgi:hypothetical protein
MAFSLAGFFSQDMALVSPASFNLATLGNFYPFGNCFSGF